MTASNFSQQIIQYQPLLIGLAFKFTKNKDAAQDLVQDTFVRALSHEKHFTQGTNLRAWLSIIMRNLFINDCRKKTRRKTDLIDDKVMEYLETGTIENEGPVHLELEEWDQQIDQLDERSQQALRMISKGYAYKEIAEVMNEPIGTIKSRIFYARKTLNKIRKSNT